MSFFRASHWKRTRPTGWSTRLRCRPKLIPIESRVAPAVIVGNVFVDANGNGMRENNEFGQPGVTVYLDLNNNGKFDPPPDPATPGEPATLSNSMGNYFLETKLIGKVTVAEIVPMGFKATTPTSGEVTIGGTVQVHGPNFGNQKLSTPPPGGGLIRGTVFIDGNGDGVRQNTEPGQGGVLVFIDANGNGMFDPPTPTAPGEPGIHTNLEGRYQIQVGKDGEYSVLEVVPLGFKMTTPPPGKVMVSGGATVEGPTFGNQKVPNPTPMGGLIRGGVFVDLNGDGLRQNNEPGQPGVIVFLDLNRNGKFDHTSSNSEPFVTSGPDGKYELKAKEDGSYAVREVPPPGFVMSTPIPGDVTVSGGNVAQGPLFGNKRVMPTPRGAISGRVFLDLNGNMQIDAGEPGLSPVRIYNDVNNDGKFNMGEPSVLSGKGGRYTIVLPAGKHQLREVVPPGLALTVSPGVIDLMGGQHVLDAHFGNQPVSPRDGSDGTGTTGWEALISNNTRASVYNFSNFDSPDTNESFNGVYVGSERL